MPSSQLILCEKRGDWAVAFRRALPELAERIRETRSCDECWDELKTAPASIVAVAVERQSVAASWEFLAKVARRFNAARTLILAAPEVRPFAWQLRSAGAVAAIFSWLEVPQIAPLVARHLAMYPSRDRSLRQQIMDRLPWRLVDGAIPWNQESNHV